MSKKTRKARAKTRTTGDYKRRDAVKSPETTKVKPEIKKTVAVSSTTSIATSQKNQYQYIGPELRRIAIIGCGLLVILIILTFVLG